MARQRGYGSRSTQDLFAELQDIQGTLQHMNDISRGSRGRGRGRGGNRTAQWTPDYPSQQTWGNNPRNPEGLWRQGMRNNNPPGPPPYRYPRNYYPPPPPPSDQWINNPRELPHSRYQDRQQNQDAPRQHTMRDVREPLAMQELIIILSQRPGFSISLLTLVEEYGFPSNQVKKVVGLNSHIFRMQNDDVVLAPRLKICFPHSSSSGCQNFKKCDSLHICPKFVLQECTEGETCILGHKWRTDHNMAILKRLSVDCVKNTVLRGLLKAQHQNQKEDQSEGQHKNGPLEVCEAYNNAGCDQIQCPNLHVCISYVLGLTNCTQDKCSLNHNLIRPACCELLQLHNISVNETPRDIAMALLQANPDLKDKARSSSRPHPTKVATQGQIRKDNKNDVTDFVQQAANRKNQISGRKGSKIKLSSASETESKTDDSYEKGRKTQKNQIPGRKKLLSASETESETDDSSDEGKKSHRLKVSHVSKAKKEGRHRHDSVEKSVSEYSTCEAESEDEKLHKTKKDRFHKHGSEEDDNNSSMTETESGDDDRPGKAKGHYTKKKSSAKQQQKDDVLQKPTKQRVAKPVPRQTVWAHYLFGDVAIPEICYYSVKAKCRDEESGCSKLHAITHFHWQVREQNGRWMNLRPKQVTCIEMAFCDPANNGVKLPLIDPYKLDSSVIGLFLLLGRDVWQADFSNNSLINSTNKKLDLRRLCTKPEGGQLIKESTYHWYFLDINKKWVKYGNADTSGKQELISSITSADIENHYLQTPQQPLSFKNSQFTFVLDLVSMKQTNQSTGTTRAVQRRPEPHLQKENHKNKDKETLDLPAHWEAMQPEERSRLVTLAPTLDEYKKVVGLVATGVSASNIVKIDRIQNPYMWRALQNKIKEMTVLYKNATQVNVKQLFHGTSHNVVANICNENFDWRLHGTSTGQAYGRGVYFATQSNTSYGYCQPDGNGHKYMFVARVAIGSMILGNASMVRPPLNPTTNMPYDSTVDNINMPGIIVKYKEQEYCPEYLLTLK